MPLLVMVLSLPPDHRQWPDTHLASGITRPFRSVTSSVEALDDAEVALDAVSKCGQRLLVSGTRMCGDCLFEAVELDQDGALAYSGVVCDDPAAAGEQPPARGLDGWTGQLVVGSKPLRVCDGAVEVGRLRSSASGSTRPARVRQGCGRTGIG